MAWWQIWTIVVSFVIMCLMLSGMEGWAGLNFLNVVLIVRVVGFVFFFRNSSSAMTSRWATSFIMALRQVWWRRRDMNWGHARMLVKCVTSYVPRAEVSDHFLSRRAEEARNSRAGIYPVCCLSPKCLIWMGVRVQLLCPQKWKGPLRNSRKPSHRPGEPEARWSAEAR